MYDEEKRERAVRECPVCFQIADGIHEKPMCTLPSLPNIEDVTRASQDLDDRPVADKPPDGHLLDLGSTSSCRRQTGQYACSHAEEVDREWSLV